MANPPIVSMTPAAPISESSLTGNPGIGAGGKLNNFIVPAEMNISPAMIRKMLSMRPVHAERDVSKIDIGAS
jgi:hypothetical protein